MLKTINRRCLALLSATFLGAGATHAVVDKKNAQIINPSKTMPGSIVSIKKIQSAHTGMPGMKMTLHIGEQKLMHVHLSTEWVLLSKRLALTPGDRIIVTGPIIKSGNQAALVAKSIKKGKKRIVLTAKETI